MKKIRVPAGTAQKFEGVFDTLQEFSSTNLNERIIRLLGSYGLNLNVVNEVVETDD
ncbi:hypothetical protein H8D85_02125 [bacterium]|nr:hypothetical protein [bacterium]